MNKKKFEYETALVEVLAIGKDIITTSNPFEDVEEDGEIPV